MLSSLSFEVETVMEAAQAPMLSAPVRHQMPDNDDIVGQPRSLHHDGSDFEGLVFEGGGTKGIVYAGAILRLEDAGLLSQVNCFAGTSAGAQTAACLAFGMSGTEMEDMMLNTPWKKLLDGAGGPCGVCRGTCRLGCSYGYYKGDWLLDYLDEKFAAKRASGERNCTFREHYIEFGTELRVGVSNLGTGKFEFLDRFSVPDMPVSLGVRASSSIPLAFVPVAYEGNVYVDGFIEGNLPISAFPNTRILAFHLTSKAKPDPMASCGAYVGSILDMMVHSSQRKHGVNIHSFTFDAQEFRTHKSVDIITINCGSHAMMETKLRKPEIEEMIKAGRNAVQRYIGIRASFASQSCAAQSYAPSQSYRDVLGALPEFVAPHGKLQGIARDRDAMQQAVQTVRLALSNGGTASGFDELSAIEAELFRLEVRDGNGMSCLKEGSSEAVTMTGSVGSSIE